MWLLWALRFGAILVPRVPARLGYEICRGVGLLAYLGACRSRRQVLGNLRHIDPSASRLQLHRAAIAVFTSVITNYFDLLRLHSVDHDDLLQLLDVYGERHLEDAVSAGKGVIIFSAHLGNFNVVVRYPAIRGWPTAVIAERIQPAALHALLTNLRSTPGLEIISQGPDVIRPIVHLLHRKGVVILAADRNLAGHDDLVPFFGEPAYLPTGPVILAMHTGATLLPAFTIRRSPSKSDVYIDPPIDLAKTGDIEADIRTNLRLMAGALERMIATDPSQWAVLQSVWRQNGAPSRSRENRLGSTSATPHRYVSRQT